MYSPSEVLAMTERQPDGRLLLILPNGVSYRLIEDVADPEILNKGDGAFHPMNPDWVLAASSDIAVGGVDAGIDVAIFILPYPRSGFLASSACGMDIFLSPGVVEVSRSRVAWTVTHEIGHVYQRAHAPGSGEAWSSYLHMRGIDEAPYSEDASHANRPMEIFAEDFRYLFGGTDSGVPGGIENQTIPLPDDVPGLEDYLVSLAAGEEYVSVETPAAFTSTLESYPNPFNPSTTVRLVLDGSPACDLERVTVAVYRIDGALVRELYRGAAPAGKIEARWDGRDAAGRAVASGVYLCVARAGSESLTRKLVLLK